MTQIQFAAGLVSSLSHDKTAPILQHLCILLAAGVHGKDSIRNALNLTARAADFVIDRALRQKLVRPQRYSDSADYELTARGLQLVNNWFNHAQAFIDFKQ